jgi:hypothetical protein
LCESLVNGGEKFSRDELRQLVDIFEFPFFPVGEDPEKLRHLRVEKKLSLRQLSKTTGHSISYLQGQLRKFGIDKAKGNFGIAPYGWDWTGKKLVPNAKEQGVLCEMKSLHRGGRSFKKIALDLNQKRILSKGGGKWWPASVSKILRRELNK